MALVTITPPAGIVKNGTEYANKTRWVDGNLVRFENGFLKPIGGWEKLFGTALDGTPIGMYAYNDNNGRRVLGIGTREKIYVLYQDTLNNVTSSITSPAFANDSQNNPLGYGAYQYGVEDWGDARSQSGLAFETKSFSFDNFGQNLLICSASDGRVFEWSPSSASSVTTLANAPTNNLGVIVTNERHVVCIGAGGDPRKIQWSERENSTSWTAAANNTAGDLQIATGGQAHYAVKYRGDIIIFTDIGINRLYYVGAPFTYGIAEAGTNCKAISRRCIVQAGDFLAWMGENSFFVYDGTVREIKSDVHDFIFDDLDTVNRLTTCGGHNQKHNEIWWFFPSGSNQSTPNKYVIWNYLDNVWSVGELGRSCWIDEGAFDFPLAGDTNNNIVQHDFGTLFNSPDLGTTQPFCETGPFEIGQGDRFAQVNQLIPDEKTTTLPGITLSFKGRNTPLGAETDFGSFTFASDGYTDARFTARQMQMKVTGDTDQAFQVGNIRADVKQRGRR